MKSIQLVLAMLLAAVSLAACGTAAGENPVGSVDTSEVNVPLSVDGDAMKTFTSIGSSPYMEVVITIEGTMPMKATVQMDQNGPYEVDEFPHDVTEGIRLETMGTVLYVWIDPDKWE